MDFEGIHLPTEIRERLDKLRTKKQPNTEVQDERH